jgi:hypothetical protein
MPGAFSEDQHENEGTWEQLLEAVRAKAVVPFLGAGASHPPLPTGAQLAETLAMRFNYPLEDRWDLARVAQYGAVMNNLMYVKRTVISELETVVPPALNPEGAAADDPHRVLADLPTPVYITTNYDLFMFQALLATGNRDPILELCRWNPLLDHLPTKLNDPGFQLHPATPVVYHLHGLLYLPSPNGRKNRMPESLVLVEDDYLQFGEEMIKRPQQLIPGVIAQHLRVASFLFIGYRLADWNFRLLLRSLKSYTVSDNYMVILPPQGQSADAVRRYLEELYGALKVRVFWGTAQDFAGELMKRKQA